LWRLEGHPEIAAFRVVQSRHLADIDEAWIAARECLDLAYPRRKPLSPFGIEEVFDDDLDHDVYIPSG
jgi:hypothetical protein